MANIKYNNIDWFGDIPTEWNVNQIGNYYELRNEKVNDYDFAPLSVTMKGVVPQLATAAKSNDHSNRKLVKKGDFVINSRSDRRGSCGISPLDGSVSLINTVMEPRGEMNPQYYNWLFHTEQFADEFYKWGHGIVDDLWTTRWQEMKKILIVAPELDEQQAIANYLDEKCSKIDEIISESKASIEDYKELKQSVIFEAVTTGLDKNVEMKNSSIEGMGLIPEKWSVVRFMKTNYVRARLGWKGLKADEYVDTGYPFLAVYHIVNNHLCWENLNYITTERYDESPEIKLSIGDLILVKDGAGIGKCARIDDMPLGEATVNSSLSVITPNELLDYRYVYYYFLSPLFQNIITRLKNGMGVPHLTQESMKDIYLPLPSRKEQEEIADFLDKKTSEIDSLISEKQSLIQDLEAYKKSLIYELVTGKRRVV